MTEEGASLDAPCESCARLSMPEPAPRDRIAVTEHWSVAHAFNANLDGWLVVLPIRHVEALDELTADEASELGGLLHGATAALRAVLGCEKSYVMLYAEAKGFPHVHFHVVPRMRQLDEQHLGPKVFGLLGNPSLPLVTDQRKDELALRLRAHLVGAGVARAPAALP